MKANVGALDRALRIGAGIALIGPAVAVIGSWGHPGGIPLFTRLLHVCPAYSLCGFSGCPHGTR